jgi:hypothetical protein
VVAACPTWQGCLKITAGHGGLKQDSREKQSGCDDPDPFPCPEGLATPTKHILGGHDSQESGRRPIDNLSSNPVEEQPLTRIGLPGFGGQEGKPNSDRKAG